MTPPIQSQLLPWLTDELKELLRNFVALGTETSKADCKLELTLDTADKKADFLTDVTSVANSFDDTNFGDHGFLIYGARAGTIVGAPTSTPAADKLQNQAEQLLKEYISPMPQVYVVEFAEPDGKRWGAVVIPPRGEKPYMFVKDLQCKDPRRTRTRGQWFVRRGATTDRGLPEDLARITQRQMSALLEPLKESLRSVQSRIGNVEEQYNSALFGLLVERSGSGSPANAAALPSSPIAEATEKALGMDLASRLKLRLRTPTDRLSEDVLEEARKLAEYISGASTGLPWAPQPSNTAGNKATIDELEEKTLPLLLAVATIVLNDEKGQYTSTLLAALKLLAKAPVVPGGVSYNRLGEGLRHYPLGLILYAVATVGVAANRGALLHDILTLPIKYPRVARISRITETYRYWYSAKELFNDAYEQRWCSPLNMRARQILADHIGEMLAGLSEPEYFFPGEFVLMLSRIDTDMSDERDPQHQIPWPGLYLYHHESVEPIIEFLSDSPAWFEKIYQHKLSDILHRFRDNAGKAAPEDCWGHRLDFVDVVKVFEEGHARKAKPAN